MVATPPNEGFNPGIPGVNEPNPYFSKPVEQPHFQSAEAELVKTGAEVLGSGIKASDEIIKAFAADDVRRATQPVIDERVSALQATQAALRLSRTAHNDIGVTSDVLPGGGVGSSALPGELANLPKVIETLRDSRANGTIDQTGFDGRMAALAKDVKARYQTGYWDYINEQFNKNEQQPATTYMKAMLGSINSTLTQMHSEREKVGTKILGALGKDPSMASVYEAWKTGHATDFQALSFVNKVEYTHTALENQKLALSVDAASQEARKNQASDIGESIVSGIAARNIESLHISGGGTPDEVAEKMSNLPPDQAVMLGRRIQMTVPGLQADMEAKLRAPLSRTNKDGSLSLILDAEGKSQNLWDIMGADKARKMIEKSTEIHNEYVKRLVGDPQHASVAMALGHIHNAQVDMMASRLFKDPSTRDTLLKTEVIRKIAGDQGMASLLSTSIGSNLGSKIKTVLDSDTIDAAAGLPDKTGLMPSVIRDLNNLQGKTTLEASDVQAYIGISDKIIDEKLDPRLRANLVNYMFKDKGLIKRLEDAGQWSTYGRLADPRFAAAVKNLGTDAWNTYTDWHKSTFGNELLKPDVLNMNDIVIPSGMKLGYGHDANGVPQYVVHDSRGQNVLDPNANVARINFSPFARKTLMNINRGLKDFAPIAKLSGEDVDMYVYRQLLQLGLNPDSKNAVGIPDALLQSIKANRSQGLELPEDQLKEKYPKR